MNLDYPHTTRFKCVKCGICCGDTPKKTRRILLLRTEAEQISKATKQPISEIAVKIEGKEPYSYEMTKTAKEGKCVFLEQNQCTIYALRPLVCRFYPFELKTTSPRKHKFTPTDECPGIGKGRMLQEEYFRKLFRLAQGRVKREQRLSETQGED
jgi:uncharacterized protein